MIFLDVYLAIGAVFFIVSLVSDIRRGMERPRWDELCAIFVITVVFWFPLMALAVLDGEQ